MATPARTIFRLSGVRRHRSSVTAHLVDGTLKQYANTQFHVEFFAMPCRSVRDLAKGRSFLERLNKETKTERNFHGSFPVLALINVLARRDRSAGTLLIFQCKQIVSNSPAVSSSSRPTAQRERGRPLSRQEKQGTWHVTANTRRRSGTRRPARTRGFGILTWVMGSSDRPHVSHHGRFRRGMKQSISS